MLASVYRRAHRQTLASRKNYQHRAESTAPAGYQLVALARGEPARPLNVRKPTDRVRGSWSGTSFGRWGSGAGPTDAVRGLRASTLWRGLYKARTHRSQPNHRNLVQDLLHRHELPLAACPDKLRRSAPRRPVYADSNPKTASCGIAAAGHHKPYTCGPRRRRTRNHRSRTPPGSYGCPPAGRISPRSRPAAMPTSAASAAISSLFTQT